MLRHKVISISLEGRAAEIHGDNRQGVYPILIRSDDIGMWMPKNCDGGDTTTAANLREEITQRYDIARSTA
ncbi:hypothetical protein AB6A40_001244 [Gnathostoma spinigerum]|uniref:Uncharacterized protein n=1 Tax=Gnathostoma spinigerum TaxID=75299 RepID=A0ABD6EDY2_9BILA